MNRDRLKDILTQVRQGTLDIEEGLNQLKGYPYEDLGFATVDHHRPLRQGFPEVVFGEGKSAHQVISIVSALLADGDSVLVTRLSAGKSEAVLQAFPQGIYHPSSRTLTVTGSEASAEPSGFILVISAGTSDLPVAEEALITARFLGNRAEYLTDVGVSGVHRLLARRNVLDEARVFIVVAGMEGALPSVVGGLVRRPVIAVPTSVGYGASFGGVAALLGMLNSCASNVAVVNIDNGFGAAYVATLINQHARF